MSDPAAAKVSTTANQRRGRPSGTKLAEGRTRLTTWVPNSMADDIIALARRHDRSISATVRAILRVKKSAQ